MAGGAGLPAGAEPEEAAGARERGRERRRWSSGRWGDGVRPGEVHLTESRAHLSSLSGAGFCTFLFLMTFRGFTGLRVGAFYITAQVKRSFEQVYVRKFLSISYMAGNARLYI